MNAVRLLLPWIPAVILATGVLLVLGPDRQRTLSLRLPLDSAITERMGPYMGTPIVLTEDERTLAGVSSYLAREYRADDDAPAWFGVYVGFYGSQAHGRTIHSPRNCLPGSGWEPLANHVERLRGPAGDSVQVNRYLLQNGSELALVVYWYQGRGRVAWNEYAVKWDLLRDAALHGRSEEALVRVVVPLNGSDEQRAWDLARRVAERLLPDVARALPS